MVPTETFSANASHIVHACLYKGRLCVLEEVMNQHMAGSRITVRTVNSGAS